jgi:hypothetical protein
MGTALGVTSRTTVQFGQLPAVRRSSPQRRMASLSAACRRRLRSCAQVAILDRGRPPNPSPESGFLEATDPCAGRPMGSSRLGTSDDLSPNLFIPGSTADQAPALRDLVEA